MKNNNRLLLCLVATAFFMLFTVSCAKNMTQTEELQTAAPPEVSETVAGSPVEDGQAAQLREERLRAEAAAREAAEAAFVKEKVHFDFNSFLLSDQARGILNKKADYLRSNPGVKITVEGHCDERGEDAYNMALGQRRADTVKTFLVNMGIEAVRMNTASFGENKPIAMGKDEASWARNRRAEFVIN